MNIISIEFAAFAVIACTLYFLLPKKYRWIELLIANILFYIISSEKLAIFLVVSTLSIYFSALWMEKIDETKKIKCKDLEKEEKKKLKNKAKSNKKIVIGITLLINFGILAVLKYGNFLGSIVHINIPKFILPLGISYYTLQATSYCLDVYRGKYKAEKNLGKVALFVTFFPQMIEGPIGRFDDLADQLYEGHPFDYTRVKFGIQLILWGVFKKLVIADRAGIFVNEVFGNYTNFGGFATILAIIMYTVQIYAEFSGCMDIVRGLAQIIGVNMAENFKRPFFSKSVQEFWRRWHITLGTWLKDYVFYSVSFSKPCMSVTNFAKKIFKDSYLVKLIPAAFATFFVWFANGIWHGASLKYILYGLYYYVIMMLGMIFEPLFKKIIEKLKINIESWWYKLIQMIRTTMFVLIGMMIFRSHRFLDACKMFLTIFKPNKLPIIGENMTTTIADFVIIGIGIILMLIVGIMQEKGIKVREKVSKKNIIIRWTLYYILIFSIIIFGIYGPGYEASNFIYGQF